jgi:two-component system response regulator NreC
LPVSRLVNQLNLDQKIRIVRPVPIGRSLDIAGNGEMTKLNILLADDSAAFRQALKNLLSRQSADWLICGEAADGEDALLKVAQLVPDVVLLDLSIPALHGLKVAEILKQDYPDVFIVIMSEQDPSLVSLLARTAGIPYAISKSSLTTDLVPVLSAIRELLEKRPSNEI